LSGTHGGSSIISAGSAGTCAHGQAPNRASQMWVNTRARSMPPPARAKAAAARMCAAAGSSPASRSAT
jgi:hypothetical protein